MLEVDQLSVTYSPPRWPARLLVRSAHEQPVKALESVSFAVERGEVLGIVGPNGAGKSTLLRAISSLLVPTSGRILLDGEILDPGEPRFRTLLGVSLADDRSLYWRLTGRQNLTYFAALAGIDRHHGPSRVDQLLTDFELAGVDKAVFGYSSGMLARLGLARAMIHDPPLLVLDEPTRSLDPIAAVDFTKRVIDLAEAGRAIIMASHRLTEVARSCHKILVLRDGRVGWLGTRADLQSGSADLLSRIEELVADEHGE